MRETSQKERRQRQREKNAEIGSQERRKMRSAEKKQQSVWFGLGMFGIIGWSVSIPTVVFLALGLWLDSTIESGVSYTLMFIVIGITLGCLNAWYWVKQESAKRE
jgi:ATP synthase protein I